MGQFLSELLLESTGKEEDGRPVYRVARPFVYHFAHSCSEGEVVVPIGYLTDLSSVPRLLWQLVQPFTGQKAAVIHDWLYEHHVYPRAMADAIFRMALRDAGVGPVRSWWMWAAVRLCGGRLFRKDAQ